MSEKQQAVSTENNIAAEDQSEANEMKSMLLEAYSGEAQPTEQEQPEMASEEVENDEVDSHTDEEVDGEDQNQEEMNDDDSEDAESDDEVEQPKESASEFVITYKGEKHKLDKKTYDEYAHKGFDYYEKTRALADERKSFEAEKQELEVELEQFVSQNEDIHNQYNQLDYFFRSLQKTDPDLFEEVQEKITDFTRHFDNPYVKKALDETKRLKQDLESQHNAKEDQAIRDQFNRELSEVKSQYSNDIKTLNLDVDWKEVENEWIRGEAADMTVDQAFWKRYGKEINMRYKNKAKLSGLKKTSGKATPTMAGKKSARQVKGKPDFKNKNLDEMFAALQSGELDHLVG